jgi:hypothetical protein
MNALPNDSDLPKDLSRPPPSIVSENEWSDFCEWARDGDYDQSYFNRFDSKCLALQQQYLEEQREQRPIPRKP